MPQNYIVTTGSVALTAATLKYMVGLSTQSNQDLQIYKVRFSFDGSVVSGNNVLIEWVSWTSDGTGTGYTPVSIGENTNKAAITTAKINYTVAPTTSLTVRDSFWIPANAAPYMEYEPLSQETEMVESKFYGYRVTSPSANNMIISVFFKE